MNSEFSFSLSDSYTKVEESSLSYYLPIVGGQIVGFMPFPRVLALCETHTAPSSISTKLNVSIYNDVNHYNTTASNLYLSLLAQFLYRDIYIYIYIYILRDRDRGRETEKERDTGGVIYIYIYPVALLRSLLN